MANRRPLLVIVALLLVICACIVCASVALAALFYPQRVVTGPTSGEFAGHYTNGFEVSSFVPCAEAGTGEAWWLGSTPESNFFPQFAALVDGNNLPPGAYATVYTRFRGTVSRPGSYGHLGAYTREVTVDEVLEMSLDGTC